MGIVFGSAEDDVIKEKVKTEQMLQAEALERIIFMKKEQERIELEIAKLKTDTKAKLLLQRKIASVYTFHPSPSNLFVRFTTPGPLFCRYLSDKMGLKTQYEQLGLSFAVASFMYGGVPALCRTFFAWRITSTKDDKIRKKLACMLFLNFWNLPGYADKPASQRFLSRYSKAGAMWLCVPAFTAWYLMRARYLCGRNEAINEK